MKFVVIGLMSVLVLTGAFAQYGKPADVAIPGQGRVASGLKNAGVRVDQRLGNVVPTDAVITTSEGRTVKLGDLMTGKPILLQLVFYECPGVCLAELNGLVLAMRAMDARNKDFQLGTLYDIITISIDPTESIRQAQSKKVIYTDLYDNPGTEKNWHFAVGTLQEVAKIAEAIGFHYRVDADGTNIVHPAALVVLTPEGKVSRYFLNTQYAATDVAASLINARDGGVGDREPDTYFFSCIQIDPLTGKISMNVLASIRAGGVLTVLAIIASILVMSFKGRRNEPKEVAN